MNRELAQLLVQMRAKGLYVPLYSEAETAGCDVAAVSELLEGSRLHELIDEIAGRAGTDDRVAAASMFQKRYSGVLLSAVLTPMTAAGVGLLAEADQVKILLEDGIPKGLVLSDDVRPLVLPERLTSYMKSFGGNDWLQVRYEDSLRSAVYTSLFDNNLGLLAMRIATEIGLSLRVMWGNIGNYSCYLYEQLVETKGVQERALRDSDSLMTCAGIGTTPLSCSCERVFLEEARPPQWVRVRSTCCLKYKLDGGCCSTCPRLSREERVAVWSVEAQ